jgi:hypothetical protein
MNEGRICAAPAMPNRRRPGNASLRGWFERHGRKRRGRRQLAVWRALVVSSVVTTSELVACAFPRVADPEHSHFVVVRRAAARYGQRLEPRTRPLRWRLKDEFRV